jgi:hypothetical protein
MAKVVLPRVHAMILCDDIERVPDEENAFNLLGVRTEIQAASFPHVHPQLCAYLQVTGHAGTVSGVVTAVNARTDEELFRAPTPQILLRDPLTVVPVFVRIQDCEFPEAGIYYIQVYLDQKLVCERLLCLTETRRTTDGQQTT